MVSLKRSSCVLFKSHAPFRADIGTETVVHDPVGVTVDGWLLAEAT